MTFSDRFATHLCTACSISKWSLELVHFVSKSHNICIVISYIMYIYMYMYVCTDKGVCTSFVLLQDTKASKEKKRGRL